MRCPSVPAWPVAWHVLLPKVRLAQTLLFWEIYVGAAILTSRFCSCGLETAPTSGSPSSCGILCISPGIPLSAPRDHRGETNRATPSGYSMFFFHYGFIRFPSLAARLLFADYEAVNLPLMCGRWRCLLCVQLAAGVNRVYTTPSGASLIHE